MPYVRKLWPDTSWDDVVCIVIASLAPEKCWTASRLLAEIANHIGWSVRYAGNVIEDYARVWPDETDAVSDETGAGQRRRSVTRTLNAPVNGAARTVGRGS